MTTLMELLQGIQNSPLGEKTIIFSQFTSLLDPLLTCVIYMTLRNYLSLCPTSLNQGISLLPKALRHFSGEPLNSRYPVRSVSVTMPPVHFQAWPEPSMRTALPIIHPYQILFAQHESLFNKTLTGLLISAQWSRICTPKYDSSTTFLEFEC